MCQALDEIAAALRLEDWLSLTTLDPAYRAVYVDGLRRLLDAVQASRAIFVSSTAVHAQDAGEWLDEDARRAYRERIADLRADLAEAEERADQGRIVVARAELEALSAELSRAVGLGGRSRRAGSAAERARVAVQRRIKDALGRIEEAAPEAGRHLTRTIYTGLLCCYRPTDPRRAR